MHGSVATVVPQQRQEQIAWALLSYRIPREPSTPRIAVWRKLKNLGVEQIGDGLVILPHDARTREHLEWIAADVVRAGGEAAVWVAHTSRTTSEQFATRMRAARNSEYKTLIDDAAAASTTTDKRTLQRLRRALRTIERRDYFKAPLRDRARLAIDALAPASVEERVDTTS
jgi:hypothetical protein